MKKNTSLRNFKIVSLGSFILLYGVFFVFPILYGFVGSFADWNPLKQQLDFIGIQNYVELVNDSLFWKSLLNTVIFTVICTVLTTAIGLVLAVLIAGLPKFKGLFKTVIYMPYVTSIMTIAIVFRWIFLPQGGLLNNILESLGMQSVPWLQSASTVMPSLMGMTVWHDVGFSLILFIAGIAEISPALYEAAAMDGASKWQLFRKITLPMLSKTMTLVVVSNIITYIQVYDQVMALTKGGPGDASYTASYYLFDKAIGYYRYGYASATAIVLMVVIFIFSAIQMKLERAE